MAKMSFNGKKITELPTWNTTTYPCAIITKDNNGNYFLYITVTAPKFNILTMFGYSYEGNLCEYQLINENWNLTKNNVAVTNFGEEQGLIWSNTDIYNTAEDLYLRSSEPILLKEENLLNLNKADFLKGMMAKLISNGVFAQRDSEVFWLIDFEYTRNKKNGNIYYTLTKWKNTYKGAPSSNCIIPDNKFIIVDL